jgi:hypothetical protein
MTRDEPITYEELRAEHKQKYDEIKALFKADLIGSFERPAASGGRDFHPKAPLMALICPPFRRSYQSSTSGSKLRGGPLAALTLRELGKGFRACCAARGPGNHEASILSNGTYLGELQGRIAIPG